MMAPPEPIAIVGLGCRFPGGVVDLSTYWDLLLAGRDAVTPVPAHRWDADAWYDADPSTPGKTNTRWGGFLTDTGPFDRAYFGLGRREADLLDPQQRWLLEVARDALADAGLEAKNVGGRRGGVYVGIFGHDHQTLGQQDPEAASAYAVTGTVLCLAPNRLSHLLDWDGPSMAIDTGCSAALTAIHLACQALRTGEIDIAIAGGVNALLAPDPMVALAKAWMLAADGRCKTFDSRADGYARAEGCGLVVLQRATDAKAPRALIRGSAVNHDGRGAGLTVPNVHAQTKVVRNALAAAGVAPAAIGYIETHGAGTAVGDPVEVAALADVFAGVPGPIYLGAVKTNMGHLETAAGIAGLIKAIGVLENGVIPPNLHLLTPNPALNLSTTPFVLPAAPTPHQVTAAGVSAFGLGGANAHVVVTSP